MIIGYNFYGEQDNLVFKTEIYHPTYDSVDLQNLTLDELLIDEDMTIPYTIDKPMGWNYRTVIDAKFQNTIEGGSVHANGLQIDKIRFQRREVDEVVWQDVGEIEYNPDKQLLYEVIDKNIQNDFEYQYTLLPMASGVLGDRVMSEEVRAGFEGVFLSDKNSNYRLLYNVETNAIQHNTNSAELEPLNSQFPITTYGSSDYRSGGIEALFVSTETTNRNDGTVSIKAEKIGRDRLMKFLKNKKPKVLRQSNGETMLINIVGQPQEEHVRNLDGLAYISFNYVEAGSMDSETLKANDIIMSVDGEF